MTCGGTTDVRVRKGKTIVAYCIAQCKRHGEKAGAETRQRCVALVAQANQTTIADKENAGESNGQVE